MLCRTGENEYVKKKKINKTAHFFFSLYGLQEESEKSQATTEPPPCSHGASETKTGAHVVISNKAVPKVLSLLHVDIICMNTHLKKFNIQILR